MTRDSELEIQAVDPTLIARCLKPLLNALSWVGSNRTLTESKPHFLSISSLQDFCSTMKKLGYKQHEFPVELRHVNQQALPCLYISDDASSPKVLLKIEGDSIAYFDSASEKTDRIIPTYEKGRIFIFGKTGATLEEKNAGGWFKSALREKEKSLYFVGFLSLIQVFLMLASPFFIINVYDKVVTTGSFSMLASFFLGVLLALVSLCFIMMVRARLLAYMGGFVQRRIGDAIFQQLLKLPIAWIESTTMGKHMAQLNDFSSVRDFFSSPLFATLVESPFVLIYLLVILIIGGWMVCVPITFIFIFMFAGYIQWRIMQKTIEEGVAVKLEREEFLVEALQRMHPLKFSGMQATWRERFARLNSQATFLNQKLVSINNAGDAVFDMLTFLAGLSTLAVGVLSVLSEKPGEHLTIGALIGVMFIVWRALSPVKIVATQFAKLSQLRRSVDQVNTLMHIQRETNREHKSVSLQLTGHIQFSQVTFRYPAADTSALWNINFTLKPGQMLALVGPNSAGKSTLLKLILALYAPQIGHIFISEREIRQYDVSQLRTQIAYVPQKTVLFYGTIAQNLRLSEPAATDEQLADAAKEAGLLKDILALPNGFDTYIRDRGSRHVSASFCQKIALARAYLRTAPILMMDEPIAGLDAHSIAIMTERLKRLKGKQTVIITTNRDSQLKLADLIIVLQEGRQILMGPPDAVLEKIPKGML